MAFTDRLRDQHDLAIDTAGHLRDLVQGHRAGDDAIAIATQLARLQGLLRIHLAEEDQYLYPALIAVKDRRAAVLAEQFQNEMGSLAWVTEDFMQRWSSSAVIAVNFAAFNLALDCLLGTLAARIERENITLYPIADALIPDLRANAA